MQTTRTLAKWNALGVLCLLPTLVFAGGNRQTQSETLVIYSGRGESLVAPVIERFTQETGIEVEVRYGGTSELAVLLSEEGDRSPADLFWAQDGGALGGLAQDEKFQILPDQVTELVPAMYRGSRNSWIATSGRARVLAFSPERTSPTDHPQSIIDLGRPEYRGRIGWAPANASLQAQVTALRVIIGDERTVEWIHSLKANDIQDYRNNTSLLEAIGAGEIDYAITNNYYLLRFKEATPDYPVEQEFFVPRDPGNLVNVAGIGVIQSSTKGRIAQQFIRFLLSPEIQTYFTRDIGEYPVVSNVSPGSRLESFQQVLDRAPTIDIGSLSDLEGTLELMQRAGAL